MDFTNLGISTSLLAKLSELGIITPTPIQQRFIPEALCHKSIIAQSQTGTGKTLAYILPVVQNHRAGERTLILVPTRELAQQIGGVVGSICCLRCVVLHGGVEYSAQREALFEKPDIIVSTVGRLKDFIAQGIVDIAGVSRFILDEVDQMLDLGFRDDILNLAKYRASTAQSLALSATIPHDVEELLLQLMPPEHITINSGEERLAVELITQRGYYVTREMMSQLLLHILRREPPRRGIIFTRSRSMADRLSKMLCENGIHAEAIHSQRGQAAREYILERFREGQTTLLVATDVIARGIDVKGVDVVYNYGMPLEAEQYIHRIGRTARGGNRGCAITLCEPDEKHLVDKVCRLMRRHITITENHPYSLPALPQKRRQRG